MHRTTISLPQTHRQEHQLTILSISAQLNTTNELEDNHPPQPGGGGGYGGGGGDGGHSC